MSSSPLQIPIIDVSPSNPNAASQLLSAAATYGFVFIENNGAGIPPADIEHVFNLSREFFAAPAEVKQEVSIASNKAGKNHGWLSRGVEKLDPGPGGQVRADVKEAFNMGEPLPNGQPQQPMPSTLVPHTDSLLAFQKSCHSLCNTVLTLLGHALGLEDESWFTSRHDQSKGPSGTVFRLLYYPHVEDYDDQLDIRAGAHSDYGSVTLLFQQRGQPGLEIKGPNGEWKPVPVDPSPTSEDSSRPLPILLNIGDLLEDWTGGLLKSTVHRVIFPKNQGAEKADRYSIAYFCHPLDDAKLEPVPSKMVEEHAAKTGKTTRRKDRGGEVLTAKDHLMERLGRSYTVK